MTEIEVIEATSRKLNLILEMLDANHPWHESWLRNEISKLDYVVTHATLDSLIGPLDEG